MENREELKRFQEDMRADRELYRKLEEIGRRMMIDGSKKSGNELMAKAAKELGYSVTAAELERAEAAAEELDDNQLEGVSGGVTAQSVQTAVERALGNASLTVPLYVDGMKLGEASIRGINAVTRSAGRILLEL